MTDNKQTNSIPNITSLAEVIISHGYGVGGAIMVSMSFVNSLVIFRNIF